MKDFLGVVLYILLVVGMIFGITCFQGWLFFLLWNKVLIGWLGLGLPAISFWLAVGVLLLINSLFKPFLTVNVKSKN